MSFRGFPMRSSNTSAARQQQGFTLVEVGIVAAILVIVAAFAVPAFNGLILENKVPKVAAELQRFIGRTKANSEGGGATPYAGINNANNLAKALRDSAILKVNDSTGLVGHGLGGAGSGSSGIVTVAPIALGGGSSGNAFSLTLTNVNEKACPVLSSVMNTSVEQITLNGVVFKELDEDNTSGTYNAVAAEVECTSGDTNTFVFATR